MAAHTNFARLHPDADVRAPDALLGIQWARIEPWTAPISSLLLPEIEGRYLASLAMQVAPPWLDDKERVELIGRWLGKSFRLKKDAHGQIDYAPAIARIRDPAWLVRTARRQWRRDRSRLRLIRGPLMTRYATAIDMMMAADARRRYEDLRENWELVADDGSTLRLPEPERAQRARYAELLAVGRGVAITATADGMEARMVTITLPSAFHPATTAGGPRHRNKNYSGVPPDEAHRELAKQWRVFTRSIGGGRGHIKVPVRWLRSVQPHKDGCPHWHIVIWARASDWPQLSDLLKTHMVDAIEVPPPENLKRRLRIDPLKGGADGAIAYISRALAYVGRVIAVRHGKKHGDEAERASAWAQTWGIRRYQWDGQTHMTAWRMLRRPTMPAPTPGLMAARTLRESGDHAAFARAVAEHGIQPAYRSGTNIYGEPCRRLVGLSEGEVVVVPTTRWKKRRRVPDSIDPPKTIPSISPGVICTLRAVISEDQDSQGHIAQSRAGRMGLSGLLISVPAHRCDNLRLITLNGIG